MQQGLLRENGRGKGEKKGETEWIFGKIDHHHHCHGNGSTRIPAKLGHGGGQDRTPSRNSRNWSPRSSHKVQGYVMQYLASFERASS